MVPPIGPAMPAFAQSLGMPSSVKISDDMHPSLTVGVKGAGAAVTTSFASLPPKGTSQVRSVTTLG